MKSSISQLSYFSRGGKAALALLGAFFTLLPGLADADTLTDIEAQCPQYATNPAYRPVIEDYNYRMSDYVKDLGCEVIPVYRAFNSSSASLLTRAEDDSDLMRGLMDLLRDREDLVDAFSHSPKVTEALGAYLAESQENRSMYLERLKMMQKDQLQAWKEDDVNLVVLSTQIPGVNVRMLRQAFRPRDLDVVAELVLHCALVSTEGEALGFTNFNSWFSANPNASLDVLKSVLNVWGADELRRVLARFADRPDFISSLIPPLNMDELAMWVDEGIQPRRFSQMQREYIRLMRELYKETAKLYSPAWGAEICTAFSELLPPALLNSTPEQIETLRGFLFALLSNRQLFDNIFTNGACFEPSNAQLFAEVVGDGAQESRVKNPPLLALAEWYNAGTAEALLNLWLARTNAAQFNASVMNARSEEPKQEQGGDLDFLQQLVAVAMVRHSLPAEHAAILDKVCAELLASGDLQPESGVSLPLMLRFVNEAAGPLFEALQKGQFNDPETVALKIVNYGFPESSDPTLFMGFCEGRPVEVQDAIVKLGSLAEQDLLAYGRTFADRHGVSKMELVEYGAYAWDAVEIGSALVATISTGGLASPALVAAVGQAAGRQAAKYAAKRTAREVVKQGSRQLVRRAGRYAGRRGAARSLPRAVWEAARRLPTTRVGKQAITVGKEEAGDQVFGYGLEKGIAGVQLMRSMFHQHERPEEILPLEPSICPREDCGEDGDQ